jgi:NAD(P)-dependent dehydrogenase (short-subunit alcohol dehydrogenase family)
MPEEYRDRHVVVTGATGGLGVAVVALLVERGATCHVPARGDGRAKFVSLPQARVRVTAGVDVSDEGSVRAFYGALPALWASIHVAGGFSMSPLADTPLAELSALWSTNTASAFLCCREATRVLRERGASDGGRIVNVAARPALEPRTGAGMAAYAASKAAVAALTQALAEELAAEGIWVNAVAPSILNTEANRRAMPAADHAKWPRVEEVAETIAFLASPSNRSTRGAVVPVYGRA